MKQGWSSDIVPDHNPSPPYAGGKAGADKTLEYAWDDYALALYAKKLGKDADYRMFLKRAGNYANVFDKSIGFMRGRTADGKWRSEEHTSELQSLMRISYAVFCLKKKIQYHN